MYLCSASHKTRSKRIADADGCQDAGMLSLETIVMRFTREEIKGNTALQLSPATDRHAYHLNVMVDLRLLEPEFRILCLEGSVTSFIIHFQ